MNHETYDPAMEIEIVREARRQGFSDDTIAARLGLCKDDPIFTIDLEGQSLGLELGGIGEGFREWELSHLQEDDKRKLLILMARIEESTYRRGLQQGWWARDTNQKFKIHPNKLRSGRESLDSARMPLCGTKMTSLERLRIQHGGILMALGLDQIDDSLQ